MALKVGFFVNQTEASLGGMFAFEQTVIATVARLTPKFSPVVISRRPIETSLPNVVLDLPSRRNPHPSLDHLAARENLDLLWFSGSFEVVHVPFVFTVLDLAHRRYPHFPEVSTEGWRFEQREEYYSRALPRAFKIIAGTPTSMEEIQQWYGVPKERIRLIPFCVPSWLGNISEDAPLPTSIVAPFFLYPAQFWAHKNHIVILKALEYLKSRFNYHCVVVFTGSDKGTAEYIRDQAARLGLSEQVLMLGFVSREDLVALYRAAVALVFPSFFGPDNLPPLEAISLSCPVIVADIVGVREFLGEAAVYVDPLDPIGWGEAMKRMSDDALLRRNLISAGRLIADERTPDHYARGVEDVIAEFSLIKERWQEV